MKIKKILHLLFCIFLCQLAGIIGSFFTSPNIKGWYTTIKKPSFNPPNYLFPIVWTILFTLMGISLFLISGKSKKASIVFFIHLFFNTIWSFLFFNLHNPVLAFVDIIILWSMIILIIFLFWEINKTASILMIPYLLWVSYASILNLSLWKMNVPFNFINDVFLFIACFVLIYVTIIFCISQVINRNDIVDVAWGFGFLLISFLSLYLSLDNNKRKILLISLIFIWALRLSTHIYIRNKRKKEDFRYKNWREQWGENFILRSFLQVFLLQGFFMYIIAMPIIIINTFSKAELNFLDIIGFSVWFIGFIFESIGDFQLDCFIKKQENKGKIMKEGLWKYTRHPNYFGEVVQWWGIFIIALSVPYGIYSIISPITITFLILKVSGIPMLEKKYEFNEEFQEYKRKTSKFFPFPPKI